MKWLFYVVVFIYMFYRAVYGAKSKEIVSLVVDPVNYGDYENYLPPNSHKSIACKYSNKNQKVEWLDPSGKLIPYSKTKRIMTQKSVSPTLRGDRLSTLLLTFTETQVEDTGEYTCRSGDLSEKLNFCVIAPADFVDTPSEVTVNEGRSFSLSCRVRGQPEPKLVWLRDEEEITEEDHDKYEGKYMVGQLYGHQGLESFLTITSIGAEDQGVYTCKAIQEHSAMENCQLEKYLNISLIVNHAPIFSDGNETKVYGKYNESFELVCLASGNPAPTFRWFHAIDENTLYEFPKDRIVSTENKMESKLSLVGNALTFGQTYICEASNEYGEVRKEFIPIKVEKPKKPGKIVVNHVSDTAIDLNVTWMEPVLFPIDGFEVEYLKEDGKKRLPKETDWKKAESFELIKEIVDMEGDEVALLIVAGLEEETSYWIRVRAYNTLGYSLWSAPICVSTTTEEEAASVERSAEAQDGSGDDETDDNDEGDDDDDEDDEPSSDTMFYGIFFAGGILVVAFVCMVGMRLV